MSDTHHALVDSPTNDGNDNIVRRVLSYVLPALFTTSGAVVSGFLIVAGMLYMKQDSLLYFPSIAGIPKRTADNPSPYKSPAESNIPFEEYMIPVYQDGRQVTRIHSWLIVHDSVASRYERATSNPDPSIPTIVFFHGNAGNIGLRLPNAIQMRRFARCHVLLVEYRGYGNSDEGIKPNEAGLKQDAEAVLQFLHQLNKHLGPSVVINPQKIILFGRSLGGAVAFHAARYAEQIKIPVQGVMVENTFTNISDMVDALLPFLSPFKRFVLRLHWNSLAILQQGLVTQTPILYLSGAADELVPPRLMRALYEATLPHLRHWHSIPDGTHNESWTQGGERYWTAVKSFIRQVLDGQQAAGATASAEVTVDGHIQAEASPIPIMPTDVLGLAARVATAEKRSESRTK
jgi:abhydrolase domain-containing protein 13